MPRKSSARRASSAPAANVTSTPPSPILPTSSTSSTSSEVESPTPTLDASSPSSSSSSPIEQICAHCNHPLSAHKGPARVNVCNKNPYCRNCGHCPKDGKNPKSGCKQPPSTNGSQPPRGGNGGGQKWNKLAVDDAWMAKLGPQKGQRGTIWAPIGYYYSDGMVYLVPVPLIDWIKALIAGLERSVVHFMGLGSEIGCAGEFRGPGNFGSALAVF